MMAQWHCRIVCIPGSHHRISDPYKTHPLAGGGFRRSHQPSKLSFLNEIFDFSFRRWLGVLADRTISQNKIEGLPFTEGELKWCGSKFSRNIDCLVIMVRRPRNIGGTKRFVEDQCQANK
jgi:hypothetical protein